MPKKRRSKASKDKGGRPRAVIDLEQVEKLAAFGCSDVQIASFMGVSQKTIQRRKKDQQAFRDAIMRGHNKLCVNLRAAQYKKAVVEGHPTMQIWMGKQFLGQRDTPVFIAPFGAGGEHRNAFPVKIAFHDESDDPKPEGE